MAHRIQSRRGNGRFQRNTMENTFGLHVKVCPKCRSFTTYEVGEATTIRCHSCGEPLSSETTPQADRDDAKQ